MAQPSSDILVDVLNRASLFLTEHGYPAKLAQDYWIYFKEWTLTELVQSLYLTVSEEDQTKFSKILERVVKDEPIQYILGFTEFMGRKFKVTPDTLIPREETTGIVDIVRKAYSVQSPQSILDIGTGTGILAITLALMYPESYVVASDISIAALEIARHNARKHQVAIDFIESDVFESIHQKPFDLIISNPPYISQEEIHLMDQSVKKYEPKHALFAEDNGLAIYKLIARDLPYYLNKNGHCILEIGFRQGPVVQKLFQYSNRTVDILQDFNGNDRYVWIR